MINDHAKIPGVWGLLVNEYVKHTRQENCSRLYGPTYIYTSGGGYVGVRGGDYSDNFLRKLFE